MLFFTPGASLWKQTHLEICTFATWVNLFFPNTQPHKLICVSYNSTWKCLILTGMSLGNTEDCFLISYLSAPRPTLTLNGLLNKKEYMLKLMLLHPNLAVKTRVVFKLCSLLITTLNYHASKTWSMYEYTLVSFNILKILQLYIEIIHFLFLFINPCFNLVQIYFWFFFFLFITS